MPKCIECAEFRAELGNWCIACRAHFRVVDVDLPCKYFKPKSAEAEVPVEASKRTEVWLRQLEPKRYADLDIGYFGPRWISKYIVKSIKAVGDISMAYDLLEADKEEK